jgi:WD40 repeat protein
VASAGADHLALVSDVRDGSIISTLKHPQTVWSISFSPDSAHVATASEDGEGRVWETRSGKMVASLKDAGPRLAPLADIRFTRAGDAVVTVGSDDTCRWWNWRTQSENFRVWGHGTASATGALALDPGGSTLAVSEPGGAVRLLDAATQKARSSFEATQGAIAGMVFDETGKVLVTAGERPGLRVFDVSGTVVEDFDQDRAFTVVAADAGAARIVAAPSEGAPVLWQRNRRTTLPLAEAPSKVLALALNPGVDVIAGATAEHGLVAWSAATGALIGKEMRPYDASTMPRDRHPVRALGFSADGRALTLVLDEDVRRVDTSTFYETDLPRLLAKAFERLPGGSALNQAIASALRGEIASAIARLEKLTNEQERQTAQRLQLLSKLQGGRFTPLDLRTYFQ